MALIHKMSQGAEGAGGGGGDESTDILHYRSINSLLDAPAAEGGAAGAAAAGGGAALARILDAAAARARPPRLPARHAQDEYGALGSPELAQSPRSPVPPACFPPRHPHLYESYSEVGSGLGGPSDGRVSREGRGSLEGHGVLEGRRSLEGHGCLEGRGLMEGRRVLEGHGCLEGRKALEGHGCLEGRGALEGRRALEGHGYPEGRGSSGGARVAAMAPDALTDLVKSLRGINLGPYCARNFPPPNEWPAEIGAMNGLDVARNRHSICLGESIAGGGGAGGAGGGATLKWMGRLAPRCADTSAGFSSKLFLGGLPWDITEDALLHTFRQFHPLRVEWPGKDGRAMCGGGGGGGGVGGMAAAAGSPRGYAYVTFESERGVRALLAASSRTTDGWFYRVSSRKMRAKEVQVIPWAVADSNFVAHGSAKLDASRTVFVGALHGMLSAGALAAIMQDLFAGVLYVGIDTDKNKYPIGSGRVTFENRRSYLRAVNAAYIEIETEKFTKKVQIDPYLEESVCSVCNIQQGPYFCREQICFQYYCRSCWQWKHGSSDHKPLTRNYKAQQPPGQQLCGGAGAGGGPQYGSVAAGHASAPVGALSPGAPRRHAGYACAPEPRPLANGASSGSDYTPPGSPRWAAHRN